MSRARSRILTVCIAAGLLIVLAAVPSLAHTRTQEATNVDSRITAAPVIDGVRFAVYTGGFLVEVENRSGLPLVIEGYEGEPYLRVGPDGVERNRRSAATYLNNDRFGEVRLPPEVDAAAPPDWERISGEPLARWHDHRTHWMSPSPPPFVEAGSLSRTAMQREYVGPVGRAGDAAGTFVQWQVPFEHDGQRHLLEGEMAWHDPAPAWPWLVLAAVLLAPALVGIRRDDTAGLVRPAALAVGLVAAANSIHLVDDLVAWPNTLVEDLPGIMHTVLFLGVGIGGAVWAWRVEQGRVFALVVGSGGVLYHQGLLHAPMLLASQFPTVWPQPLARFTVALGLVQAVVVAIVTVVAVRREVLRLAVDGDTAARTMAALEETTPGIDDPALARQDPAGVPTSTTSDTPA